MQKLILGEYIDRIGYLKINKKKPNQYQMRHRRVTVRPI